MRLSINKRIKIFLLLVVPLLGVQAQVPPLVELSIQQYSQNLSGLLTDLQLGKLNTEIEDVLKKQLIQQHPDLFPIPTLKILNHLSKSDLIRVAFSPDGTQALTESDKNKTTHLWDLSTGQIIKTIPLSH